MEAIYLSGIIDASEQRLYRSAPEKPLDFLVNNLMSYSFNLKAELDVKFLIS